MGFVLLYRDHAERAIEIINSILPEDHLLLASSKRVKGKTLNVSKVKSVKSLSIVLWP